MGVVVGEAWMVTDMDGCLTRRWVQCKQKHTGAGGGSEGHEKVVRAARGEAKGARGGGNSKKSIRDI